MSNSVILLILETSACVQIYMIFVLGIAPGIYCYITNCSWQHVYLFILIMNYNASKGEHTLVISDSGSASWGGLTRLEDTLPKVAYSQAW